MTLNKTLLSYSPRFEIFDHFQLNGDHSSKDLVIPIPLWSDFQKLIQRGAQTWADAPPGIKELADLVTNGTVLQNYWEQNKDMQKKYEQKKSD